MTTSKNARMPRRRVGLVLGAGGATGAAFHAGTLHALRHDRGWNPNDADVIVGSSAGSIVGTLLRAGLSTDDLCAWAAAIDPQPSGLTSRALLDDIQSSRSRVAPTLPRPAWPSPTLLLNVLRSTRAHTAALSLLPQGWIDAPANLARLGDLLVEWPARRLWISAVRTRDARRVVFGRGELDVSPGTAVAASCAIPGLFRPVTVGHERFIDGGAHSPTNADLLVDAGVDVAIILSPMSARTSARRRRPDHHLRAMFQRRLKAECATLSAAGVEVYVFEPDAASLDVMGINALDTSRGGRVVCETFFAAGAQLAADPDLTRLLDRLGNAADDEPGERRRAS